MGWDGREGLTDAGNQFHYYRRTLDDRVLFGGYDANYHFPGRIDPGLEQSGVARAAGPPLLRDLPPARRAPLHAPVGRRHRHHLAVHPVFGTALGGRLSYAVGSTGLGVASTRFGARVALDLSTVATVRSPAWGLRRKPMPFPPEPIRFAAVRATRASLAARTAPAGATSGRGLDTAGIGFDS